MLGYSVGISGCKGEKRVVNILYLATKTGLVIAQRENNTWQALDHVLPDQPITSVIARDGVILAGTMEGIQRSDDNGQQWRVVNNGLTHTHIRWLAHHPNMPNLTFAGTEPAGIFVSRDGAAQWTACPEVGALRDK